VIDNCLGAELEKMIRSILNVKDAVNLLLVAYGPEELPLYFCLIHVGFPEEPTTKLTGGFGTQRKSRPV